MYRGLTPTLVALLPNWAVSITFFGLLLENDLSPLQLQIFSPYVSGCSFKCFPIAILFLPPIFLSLSRDWFDVACVKSIWLNYTTMNTCFEKKYAFLFFLCPNHLEAPLFFFLSFVAFPPSPLFWWNRIIFCQKARGLL